MHAQTVTLNLPDALYRQLEHRAVRANRTVEAEVLEVLATAVPEAETLPADLAQAVSTLALLDDAQLWQAARTRLARETAARMEELNLTQQREGLTGDEKQELAGLVRQYERVMLVRAEAAALLHERGHNVSELLTPP
jgi:plasmid stability protein